MNLQKIRVGGLNDAKCLAKIHKRAISVDILSIINNDDVLYRFYLNLLSSEDILVAVKEINQENIISFAVFIKSSARYDSILKKFFFGEILQIFLSCIKSTKALKMIIGRLKKPIICTTLNISDYPELIICATDPHYQSKGFGSEVVQFGLETMSLKNCIVKTHSPDAKIFYSRLGFIEIGYEKTGNWDLSILLYSN
jgi:ribosomal protein S18 acetylase RimI-like enzyme